MKSNGLVSVFLTRSAVLLVTACLVTAAYAEQADMVTRRALYECQKKAAEYTYNLDKAGDQELFDKHVQQCLEVGKVTVAAAQQKEVLLDSLPVCSGSDAVWCSPCWNTDTNGWCCKSKNSPTFPDCGGTVISQQGGKKVVDDRWKYTKCNQSGSCVNLCKKPGKADKKSTNIRIKNLTGADVPIAFVTGASGGACKDMNTMISYQWVAANTSWCKKPTQDGGDANAGYCTGTVPKGGQVELSRSGEDGLKCLTGAIHLGGRQSCPPPNGFTQAEFTLNPTDSEMEAVDISLVNGVNYALSANLIGDGWAIQDGGAPVSSIGPNEGINGNNNKAGIFPPGCTDCIVAVQGRIPCDKLTPNPKCQQSRICNIQRGLTGGTVEFVIVKDLQ